MEEHKDINDEAHELTLQFERIAGRLSYLLLHADENESSELETAAARIGITLNEVRRSRETE